MEKILQAILNGATGEEIAALPLPATYRAAYVRKEDQTMWDGVPSNEKDPRKSIHIGQVDLPELAADEVVIAVMASSINLTPSGPAFLSPSVPLAH